MKHHKLLLAFLLILSIKGFSQIKFEQGYFIDDTNQRVEGLIKNVDWKSNPTEFEYKLSHDTPVQKASLESVQEFGINGVSRYVRKTVRIDRSTDAISSLTSEKNPSFQEERLFLKVLVEGKASLYEYEDGNLIRFFYRLNDSEVEPLIYRRYYINNRIGQNNKFRQQLFTNLDCPSITLKNVEKLNYTKRDLEQLFVEYNECTNSEYIEYDARQKKDLFNLSVRPGLNYSNLAIANPLSDFGIIDFGNKVGFRLGVETEFILPFNKNKWGIILEPTYQYYRAERATETNRVSGGILFSEVDYQSIELPVGVRHYFFLNEDSKIFADISYILIFSDKSTIELTGDDGLLLDSLKLKSGGNLGLGLGYEFLDKYSLSVRYQLDREVFQDYAYWNSRYRTFSVILGYSLF